MVSSDLSSPLSITYFWASFRSLLYFNYESSKSTLSVPLLLIRKHVHYKMQTSDSHSCNRLCYALGALQKNAILSLILGTSFHKYNILSSKVAHNSNATLQVNSLLSISLSLRMSAMHSPDAHTRLLFGWQPEASMHQRVLVTDNINLCCQNLLHLRIKFFESLQSTELVLHCENLYNLFWSPQIK